MTLEAVKDAENKTLWTWTRTVETKENRIRFYKLQMMILPDTDFKATMLNMSKEIGNDLKIDARNKNCKRWYNIFERKKNQTAIEIKT